MLAEYTPIFNTVYVAEDVTFRDVTRMLRRMLLLGMLRGCYSKGRYEDVIFRDVTYEKFLRSFYRRNHIDCPSNYPLHRTVAASKTVLVALLFD